MSATPLYTAVAEYLGRNAARLHMPGHKGLPVAGSPLPWKEMLPWDITEVAGADSLFEACGPIAETEARYSRLYGTAGTLLSAGGSTLCIQTMLALATKPGDKVICARGIHTAAVSAMALLDLHPAWVFPKLDETTGLCLPVTPSQIKDAFGEHPNAAAVYLTSPDYFGMMADIEAIAALCRARGVPLLVDNAHGAHLAFLDGTLHPIALGADLCCDSLHKTLPVLTGGALLHVGNSRFLQGAKRRMSLFGSTSPSYLILLSIDGALPYLEERAAGELAQVAKRVARLEALAVSQDFLLPPGHRDPTRLSLGFSALGYSPGDFREHLFCHGIEPEYVADTFCVLLPAPGNCETDYARLETAIRGAKQQPNRPGFSVPSLFAPPRARTSVRDAVLAPAETVGLEQASGRVCAGFVAACPPGIPLALPGEELDKNLCNLLKKCGISSLDVLK